MDDNNWKAESDLRTLFDAKAIQADKARMKAVSELAKTKLSDLKDIVTDNLEEQGE